MLRDRLGERFVVGVVLHTGSHCIRYAAGPVIPEAEIKSATWLTTYEDVNVDVDLATGPAPVRRPSSARTSGARPMSALAYATRGQEFDGQFSTVRPDIGKSAVFAVARTAPMPTAADAMRQSA